MAATKPKLPSTASTTHSASSAVSLIGGFSSIFRKTNEPISAGCPHVVGLKSPLSSAENNSSTFLKSFQLLCRYSLLFRSRSQLQLSKKDKRSLFTEMDEDGDGGEETDGMSAKTKKRNRALLEGVFESLEQLPTPKCSQCESTLGRLHLCLHCVFAGCFTSLRHINKHSLDRGHLMAMEFNTCSLYCFGCKDYIHDMDLDRVHDYEKRLLVDILTMIKEPTLKRVKPVMWRPTNQEMELVRKRSKPLPCSGVRGLRNLGSTCFMNAVLQTLIHNPMLRGHFLSDRHNSKMCSLSLCLACQLDKLFNNIYNGQNTPYGPDSFLHAMWISQSHLAGYSEKDAHEFFISILNEVHSNCGGKEGVKNCQCIIHNVFSGTLQSDVTCLKCGNVTTAFDPILDISLDVKNTILTKKVSAASKKKLSSAAQLGVDAASPDASTTLAECLEIFTRPERLGPNAYSCSECGNTFQESTKQMSIKNLPPVLSIQLKRFEHSAVSTSKIETQVHIPINLDMTPYSTRWMVSKNSSPMKKSRRVSAASPEQQAPTAAAAVAAANLARRSSKVNQFDAVKESLPSHRYTLLGVINHTGKLETGHYTSFVKVRGEWFLFDDHNVSLASEKQVLSGQPYMLFYIKQHHEFSPMAAVESDPHHHTFSPVHKQTPALSTSASLRGVGREVELYETGSMDVDNNNELEEGEELEDHEEDQEEDQLFDDDEEVYELDDDEDDEVLSSNYDFS